MVLKENRNREEKEPIKRVFIYVLFSIAHFLQEKKIVRNCIFSIYNFLQNLFSKRYIRPTLLVKSGVFVSS